MMFLKPKAEDSSKKLEKKLKKIIRKRCIEAERVKAVPYQKLYNRMVKEASWIVSEKLKRAANFDKDVVAGTTLEAYHAFYVKTETLNLYTDAVFVYNPYTGKSCLSDEFKFSSLEEVDQYVADVKKFLPAGIEVVKEESNWFAKNENRLYFTFKLRVD